MNATTWNSVIPELIDAKLSTLNRLRLQVAELLEDPKALECGAYSGLEPRAYA
jgi:hypothetical protein